MLPCFWKKRKQLFLCLAYIKELVITMQGNSGYHYNLCGDQHMSFSPVEAQNKPLDEVEKRFIVVRYGFDVEGKLW